MSIEEIAAQLQHVAVGCDFADPRLRNQSSRYIELLSRIEQVSLLEPETLSPSLLSVIIAVPVQALTQSLPMPLLVVDAWVTFIQRVRGARLHTAVAMHTPKLLELAASLAKDRSDTTGLGPPCLTAALDLLCALQRSDSDGLSCLTPSVLPHPTKTLAQAPRLAAYRIAAQLCSQVLPAPALISYEWMEYMRKGIEAKEFAVCEAAVQALSTAVAVRGVPSSHFAATLSTLVRVADGPFSSPKLQQCIAKCIGEMIAHLFMPPDEGSIGRQSSSWGLWRASPSSPAAAVGVDPWSYFYGLVKAPMTKTLQFTLGDALGCLLAACSKRDRRWYTHALEKLLPLLQPTPVDTRAYVPKLITRGVQLWCDSSENDSQRHEILQSMTPLLSPDASKLVLQTVLACATGAIRSVATLRPECAGPLFAASKALVLAGTAVTNSAAELCGLVASHDVNAAVVLNAMVADLFEDASADPRALPSPLHGLAKTLASQPAVVWERDGRSLKATMFSLIRVFCQSPEPDAQLAISDVLVRRWEVGHQLVQTVMDRCPVLSQSCLQVLLRCCQEHQQHIVHFAHGTPHWSRLATCCLTSIRKLYERTAALGLGEMDDSIHPVALALCKVCTRSAVFSEALSSPTSPTPSNQQLAQKLASEALLCWASRPSLIAPPKRRAVVVSLALQEIMNGCRLRVPCCREDAEVYPPAVALFMSTCRRTSPTTSQMQAAALLNAAMDALAASFAHPQCSVAERGEIIASLFDILATPGMDPTIVKWNTVCALCRLLDRDTEGTLRSRETTRQLWRLKSGVARTLRSQLLDDFLASPVLDIQCMAAKCLAQLATVVDDDVVEVSRLAIGCVSADATTRCGLLLFLGCYFSLPDAPMQMMPLVTSHIVSSLKSVELFGDPCGALAIALLASLVMLAEMHPDSVCRDVFLPCVVPIFLRPSALPVDSMIYALFRALTAMLADSSQPEGMRSLTALVANCWFDALENTVEPNLVLGSLAVLHRYSNRLKRIGGAAYLQSLAVCVGNIGSTPCLLLKTTAFVPQILCELGVCPLSLKDLAHRIDAARNSDERQRWRDIAAPLLAACDGRRAETLDRTLRDISTVSTMKAAAGVPESEEVIAGSHAARKSEEYGEDVDDARKRQTPKTQTAPLRTADIPAKLAAAHWLMLVIDRLAAASAAQRDELMRVVCVMTALADTQLALAPAVTALLTVVLRRLFSSNTPLVDHTDERLFVAAYRTQVGSMVRQLVRSIHSSSSAAETGALMQAFVQSLVADDTSCSRALVMLLTRIRIIGEHTTDSLQSIDASISPLLLGVAEALDKAAASNWSATQEAVATFFATEPRFQEVVAKVCTAALHQVSWRAGRYCGPADAFFVAHDSMVCIFQLVDVTTKRSTDSSWLGPSLRQALGSLFAAMLTAQGLQLLPELKPQLMATAPSVMRVVSAHQQRLVAAAIAGRIAAMVASGTPPTLRDLVHSADALLFAPCGAMDAVNVPLQSIVERDVRGRGDAEAVEGLGYVYFASVCASQGFVDAFKHSSTCCSAIERLTLPAFVHCASVVGAPTTQRIVDYVAAHNSTSAPVIFLLSTALPTESRLAAALATVVLTGVDAFIKENYLQQCAAVFPRAAPWLLVGLLVVCSSGKTNSVGRLAGLVDVASIVTEMVSDAALAAFALPLAAELTPHMSAAARGGLRSAIECALQNAVVRQSATVLNDTQKSTVRELLAGDTQKAAEPLTRTSTRSRLSINVGSFQ